MMKERAWVRSWLSGFLLVVVLGHVQAQDNVEQLDITSFTLDTTLPTMTVKVCFTDTADSDLGNLDTSLVTLTCGSSADDPNQVILECTDTAAEIIPNYCSTHKFAKPFNAYEKTVYCLLDATDKTVDDSPPRSGSAEFEIPGQEAFPACTDAYTLVDQLLVGVVCSEVGSFDKVVLNSGKVTGNIKATTNVIYISHTDVASTVSFCTTIDNSASGTSGPLDICIPEMTIESTDTDFDTTASELTYTDSGATLTVTFPGTGTYDLVVMKGDSIENVDTVETEPTNTATTNIDIYNKGDGIHFVAVKKDDNSLTKADVTITDYNLRVMALTSYTLEMVWENKENANLFKIERTSTDETDTSFKTAHVNCTGLGSCFGYFVELIPDTEYTCSVSQNDESFKITHQAVSTMPMTTGFSVRQLTLKWNSELNSADTSVCFDQEDATASDVSSYLELIMINSQGKILKSRRTTQTMQGILCFENILIETSTFSLSEGKVNVVVLNRDVNSHTVLTSGEAELFLISPEIKAVGARGGHISWDNPGGYSITTMMEGHSTHLGATTTGRLRHYFFPKKTEERLVVEADASGVKMTAVVPLTSTGAAESIVINEIVLKKQVNNVDICYEAIPTSPTVDHALITIIIIVSDSTANEINVAATISTDNCVTFADPALTVGDNIVLELQLYSSTDSSSLLGQGSIAFIMEDYQDLATCTSVSKFSDGMYRLVCEPVVKEGDNIMVDNTQMDILGSSDYGKNTHYVILKDVPTDAATLKVYRDISDVTVNDDTKGPVRVTRGTVTISDTPAPSEIFTALTLAYETPRVEVTTDTTTSTNFDIVIYWTKDVTDGTYNVAACPDINVAVDPLSCDATEYTTGTSLVNVLLVGYTDSTDNVLESDVQTLQDYYITGSFVSSSTIEWQWTMEPQTKSPVNEYLATILPEDESDPSPTFITAEVTCDTSDIQCYVFFLGLTSTNHYAVMIQPKSGNDYDSLNQVISEKVTGGTSASRGLRVSSDQLRVEEVELDWRRDGVRVDVGVCFHYRDATMDDTGLTQYQLVLVDAEGRWRGVHGASHTREGRLCFSRVTLDSRQFNTAEEVTVLVIKRDVDGRTVLASGESHVFFIRGSVDSRGSSVSWNNPGNYTFTLYKEGQPHPLATSLTCHTCTHSLTTQALGEDLRSVLRLETQDSTVKLTARIPQDVSFTDMPGAITINYMTFPITKGNPSGASVSTLLNVKCDTAAAENSSFFLAFSVPESDGTSVHEYNDAVDVDKITVEPMNVTFENMQDYAFVPENDVTVFVTVQDSNRVTRDFGYAEVKLRDPEATSYRVGKKEDDSYEGLRITYSLSEDGDSRAQLGYDDLCKCDNSPCYCLGSDSVTTDPQTLCLQLKTTKSEPTVGSLLQCTDDLQADDSTTMTTITGVKMTHLKDIDNVDVQVDVDSSNKVELLFYKARDTSLHVPGGTCDGTKQSCTMNYQFTNSDQVDYSVLVVTVESDQAVDSALLSFEDYKTTPQQLTSDVVEVRFSAKTDTTYRVDISPNGGAFDYTTLDCGGEESINCDVFFIMMTPGDYTAIVKQDQEGENNVVAADFTMVDAEEFFRNATLHHRVQGNETYLSVCVGGSFTSNTTSNYTLVIIYRENKNIMTTSALQETTCFPEVLLTLRTNQQVKVLILTDEKHRHVVRETDIYLLDPPSAGESISQVGSKTLKAIWNNRNQVEVKYLVGVAGEVQPVECPAGQECIQYIHLNSTTDKKNVTLEEHNQDTVQVVSFQIEPQTISQFPILDWSIRWDDHLRVCFSQPAGAASYELGLQKGVQHLETTSQAPIDTQDAVETCVLSTETIDVGAYIDLWMLVTAYDFDGNIIASGEHTWSAIFLSSGYRVQAAIKDSNIIATWHLIDDVSTIDNFNVILRSVDSESTVTVSSEMSTYVLNSVAPGTYAVCVNAMKQLSKTESVQSEEVCSDILVVSDTIADVPHVEEVEPKSTAETSVLVTWQRPVSEDVSAFYVTWTNQSTPARRSLGSPRLPPQSLTRRYTGLQGAVPGVTGMGSGFTIVPAFYTSLEVTDLQQGAKYTFCVSSIKNDVVDQDSKCSVSDLGSFEKLDPPEDLRANEKVLGWSGTETSTYLVEWFPNEKGRAGNEVVTGTTYTLNVTAGTWNISVRTVTSESSSDPRLNATHISGLISSPKQSGSKVVEVVWWEVPTPQADSAYVVTLEDGEMPSPQYTKVCSGDSRKNDCSLLFTLNVDTSKVTDINVSIQRSTLLGSSYFKLEPIEEVNPALSVRSANEVVVEWQKVDNAKYYIVSLYQDASLSNMRWRKQQTLPLRVTVQEDNLMGNYMTIQACVDSLHCGDIYQTSIMHDTGGDKNRGVVAGVVGGVLGAVLLAGIIFIVMKHKTVKRKERLEIKSVPREEEMTPRQNIFDYDEWGARRLGQPPVAQITVNVK